MLAKHLATALLSALALSACATYEEDLSHSQRAFDASEHEHALAILRALEPDIGRLSTSDRARYAYLRGMTDYRIGYRLDARHWLGVAVAIEQQTPGSIPPESVTRLNEALKEMNEAVYTSGIQSLSNEAVSSNAVRTTPADDSEGASGAEPAPQRKAPPKSDPGP